MNVKKIYTLAGLLIVFTATILSCEKKPYMPDSDPTPVEIGSGDATYGGNNDAQPKLSSLKIMTYNIHALNPPTKPGETDLQATAQVIIDSDADIVFLQEVDKNTGRYNFSDDQAKKLGELAKMNFAFYSATSVGRGFYGVAMLSKYPIKNVKKYMLTKENSSTEQRVLGIGYIDLPGVDSVLAAVTHLQHNSATNRMQQVRDVVNTLTAFNDKIVIGGDFNERESATEFFGIFDGAFKRTCVGVACPPTFSTQLPNAVIDYLAFRPSSAFTVKSHSVIYETYASDHFPVIAELNFNR